LDFEFRFKISSEFDSLIFVAFQMFLASIYHNISATFSISSLYQRYASFGIRFVLIFT